MLIFTLIAGAATGIVLGLFGSGGSIIALPALMYLLGIEAKSAIAMSLGIVAVTATITAWDHWRRNNVDVRVATVFGGFGIVGTFAGAKLGLLTPVLVQLVLFALVMYAAAWKMLKPVLLPQPAFAGSLPPAERMGEVRLGHIAAHGIGVGVLTGVVGYLGAVPIDWTVMLSFTAVTIAGSFAGTRLAHRFSPERLRTAFGGFLVVVATYILMKGTS